jgi:hypothetical protein
MPVRDFLTENEVPSDLVEELFKHLPTEVYRLTEHDEEMLGVKSAAFQRFLVKNCAWDDAIEKAVFRGERLEEMKTLSACRIRVTLPAARKALAQAIKENVPEGKSSEAKARESKATTPKPRAEAGATAGAGVRASGPTSAVAP